MEGETLKLPFSHQIDCFEKNEEKKEIEKWRKERMKEYERKEGEKKEPEKKHASRASCIRKGNCHSCH